MAYGYIITGIEHKILFATCACECLPITLARAELWPATPCNPHMASTFALLDLAEVLMLECLVSLKDFCNGLMFRCPFIFDTSGGKVLIVNIILKQKKNIYSSLINPFEEHRCPASNREQCACMMAIYSHVTYYTFYAQISQAQTQSS